MPALTVTRTPPSGQNTSGSSERTNTLIVTNLPTVFFHPSVLQALRDHFATYGEIHAWAPLRSFGRIIIVYYEEQVAERVKFECDNLTVDATSTRYVFFPNKFVMSNSYLPLLVPKPRCGYIEQTQHRFICSLLPHHQVLHPSTFVLQPKKRTSSSHLPAPRPSAGNLSGKTPRTQRHSQTTSSPRSASSSSRSAPRRAGPGPPPPRGPGHSNVDSVGPLLVWVRLLFSPWHAPHPLSQHPPRSHTLCVPHKIACDDRGR